MTTIAWDGKTLAADKMATNNGFCFRTFKLFKLWDGGIGGFAGVPDVALDVVHWLNEGADKSKKPTTSDWNNDCPFLLVITPNREILRYEKHLVPFPVEEPFHAIGSGRDFAIAAMACGKTAEEAIEITSRFDAGTGMGIDTLTLTTR